MELTALQQQLVTAELKDGERIVWSGQPVLRGNPYWLLFVPGLAALSFAAILFRIGFAGKLAAPFLGGQAPPPMLLFNHVPPDFGGACLLSLGFGLFGPYWQRRAERLAVTKTVYVITDRRAIVFDGGYRGNPQYGGKLPQKRKAVYPRFYGPDAIGPIRYDQRRDGSGDVTFGEGPLKAFFSIAEVKKVETLLRSLARPGIAVTSPALDRASKATTDASAAEPSDDRPPGKGLEVEIVGSQLIACMPRAIASPLVLLACIVAGMFVVGGAMMTISYLIGDYVMLCCSGLGVVLVFWGVFSRRYELFGKVYVLVESNRLTFKKELFGREVFLEFPLDPANRATLVLVKGKPDAVTFKGMERRTRFGEFLDSGQCKWLVSRINRHLDAAAFPQEPGPA